MQCVGPTRHGTLLEGGTVHKIFLGKLTFSERILASINMTDVFLMVRRMKSTFFLMCKEKDTVAVVKKMLAGIVKKDVEEIRIFQQRENLESGEK